MAKFSMWLPPFSPDYSGAVSVLFDLKTVTAMHDASGCTGNYTGYDEARWYGSKSAVFCSGLRSIDAILGNDDKLIKKMKAAAKDIEPDILALIGSPVPMVIGADLKGIAAQLEEETGIPSFGFDTTGTAYYDRGAFAAAKALLNRFAVRDPEGRKPKRVNILGALPMDFGQGKDIGNLKELLKEKGYHTGLCLAMGYSLDDLKHAPEASVNLAVSRFGWLTARFMEQKFGIPYLCGFPAGEKGEKDWLEALETVEQSGKSRYLWQEENGADQEENPENSVLIIGEQVMADSIRYALKKDRLAGSVTVGCLYGLQKELGRPGDLDLTEERRIRDAVRDEKYKRIIGDPFLRLLPEIKKRPAGTLVPFSQYAVSSKLGQADAACMEGKHLEKWWKKQNVKQEEKTE